MTVLGKEHPGEALGGGNVGEGRGRVDSICAVALTRQME